MDVVVKVVLDEKEYDRLLDIERKYNDLAGQKGAGSDACSCQAGGGKAPPLSQIIVENATAHAIDRPVAGVLPSITAPDREESAKQVIPPGTSGLDVQNLHADVKHQKETSSKKHKKKVLSFNSLTEAEKEELGYPRAVFPWYFIGIPKR